MRNANGTFLSMILCLRSVRDFAVLHPDFLQFRVLMSQTAPHFTNFLEFSPMDTPDCLVLCESVYDEDRVGIDGHVVRPVQEAQEPHELVVHELEILHTELFVQVIGGAWGVEGDTVPYTVDGALPDPGIGLPVAPVDYPVRVLAVEFP